MCVLFEFVAGDEPEEMMKTGYACWYPTKATTKHKEKYFVTFVP